MFIKKDQVTANYTKRKQPVVAWRLLGGRHYNRVKGIFWE